jgi:hypothetical protein
VDVVRSLTVVLEVVAQVVIAHQQQHRLRSELLTPLRLVLAAMVRHHQALMARMEIIPYFRLLLQLVAVVVVRQEIPQH